jgi:hypothetical protein
MEHKTQDNGSSYTSMHYVLILLFFCILKMSMHLISDSHSGFQGDELLHIETGHHPAWGYMEFPPMIGWLAFLQDLFHSQSVYVHHIFTHIASLLILLILTVTTVALGGNRKAVFMVLLCMLAAPCFGRSQQLFQPVVFSQFFWALSFYQLVMFVKTLDQKYLLYLTISIGLGFLTKYDIVFFIAGIVGLFFFERTRKAISFMYLLKCIVLFLAITGPNIYWQYQHHFPLFQMFSRLYETQLDHLTIAGVIGGLVLSLDPLTAIFWIGGCVYMFTASDKTIYRPLALSILISLSFLALSRSKDYYFYSAIVSLLIFGSIWFERAILSRKAWLLYPASILLLLSGALMAPFGLAILPLDSFIRFAHIKEQNGHYQIPYQEYYSKSKQENTMTALQSVYDSLPEIEKKNCLIWGKHYSQAGGVELYRQAYGLPHAFSYHGSFYLWAPDGDMPETVIAFTNGEAGIDFFQPFFDSVTPVKRVYNRYADFDKDLWQTIYICRHPKQNFKELKAAFDTRVFE